MLPVAAWQVRCAFVDCPLVRRRTIPPFHKGGRLLFGGRIIFEAGLVPVHGRALDAHTRAAAVAPLCDQLEDQ